MKVLTKVQKKGEYCSKPSADDTKVHNADLGTVPESEGGVFRVLHVRCFHV